MKNLNKKIILFILVLFFAVISFVLFKLDLIGYFIISATITGIVVIYLIYTLFEKESVQSRYKNRLNGILKTYDSLLRLSNEEYSTDGCDVMFVKKIEDMVEYCEELNKTITYIPKEDTTIFVLKNGREMLIHVMRRTASTNPGIQNALKTNE